MYDCQRWRCSNGKHPQRKQSIKAKYLDVRCHLRKWPQIETAANSKVQGDNYDLKTVKGKAVLLQAWSGPEGSRKLRFPDFMTTAQDGDKVVSLTHRPPLPPGNTAGTHFF